MPNDFVIYGYPRTGSYHLMSLLDSCNDIVCHGEIFKPDRIELRRWHRRRLGIRLPQDRDARPLAYIRQLRSLTPYKHFGFKIFPSHIDRVPRLAHIPRSSAWKTVVLYRDPVATYASLLRAQQTSIWTLRAEGDPPNRAALHVPVDYTEDSLCAFSSVYNRFLNTARIISEQGANSFVIHYDQINDMTVLESLLSFLGSQHHSALSSDYRKQFGGTLPESFRNWDALQARLARDWPFAAEPVVSARQDTQ